MFSSLCPESTSVVNFKPDFLLFLGRPVLLLHRAKFIGDVGIIGV